MCDISIKDKFDSKNTQKIFDLGIPKVIPKIPYLLEWIQDMNWPVSKEIASFLVTLGSISFQM